MPPVFEPEPMLPRPFLIKERREDATDTFTLALEAADGRPAAQMPMPGQFNMLYVFGAGEVPISVTEASNNRLYHTIRTVGSVTRAMSKLGPDDMVGLRGPYGTCWPLDAAPGKDVILIAGGIGVVPLRCAIAPLLTPEACRSLTLLYGARTPADVLFSHEFERWRSAGLHLHVTVDRGNRDWNGNVGVVTTLIPRTSFDPLNCLAMVCGPEIMMRFTVAELQKAGVPDTSIFLSLERNMKCAVGFCGHCQFGPDFICKDGPIFRYDRIRAWWKIREL